MAASTLTLYMMMMMTTMCIGGVHTKEDLGLGTGADVDQDRELGDDNAASSSGGTEARGRFARPAWPQHGPPAVADLQRSWERSN